MCMKVEEWRRINTVETTADSDEPAEQNEVYIKVDL